MIKFEVNQQSGKKISIKLIQGWTKKIEKNIKLKKNLEISFGVVGASTMKNLNKSYRKKYKVTNVLSFREGDSKVKLPSNNNYLGEIIICYPQAVKEAKQARQPINQYLESLFLHGFLHLLGYDHKSRKDAKVMEKLEKKILGAKFQSLMPFGS